MKAFVLPLLLLGSLAACAGSVETRISSSGVAGMGPASYAWADMAGAHPDLTEAQRLVAEKLADSGLVQSKVGALQVEITLAKRPADLALITGGKDVIAPARQKRLFGRCGDQEYRLGIAITRISDGASLYRGSAAEHHCKTPLASVLPHLVKAAMADLGRPRGLYIVRRPGRELPASPR